jgi:uncharacterized protein (TIGR00299 family) protein
MRIAYGDLIGGISGDMFVAALLDVGLSLSKLKSELRKIPTLRFKLEIKKQTVNGIAATRFQVICPQRESDRSWKQIRRLIGRSKLRSEVKETGLRIFSRLAEAEGKIHGVTPDAVHFHEIGATDSIVDIMAAAIGITELGINSWHFSRIPLGRGITGSRHGSLPVPAPATLELLRNIAVQVTDVEGETVTPTGAAIVSAIGKGFGQQPNMTIEKIGYGAGQKEFPCRPNLFRLIVGSTETAWKREEMLVIETNIDDMNPEFYDHIMDCLFVAGARDVFLAPIQMKKNRPGTLLRVIADTSDRDKLTRVIFHETSTIGIRYYPVSRLVLNRTSAMVKTRFGTVRVKVVEQPDGTKRATPEYDELKRLATAKKVPLMLVHEEVMRTFKK